MKDMKDDHDEDKPLPVSMTLRYAAIDASGKISDDAYKPSYWLSVSLKKLG